MRLNRLMTNRLLHALGDCSECGHSVIYYLPLIGCTKCSCDEFH